MEWPEKKSWYSLPTPHSHSLTPTTLLPLPYSHYLTPTPLLPVLKPTVNHTPSLRPMYVLNILSSGLLLRIQIIIILRLSFEIQVAKATNGQMDKYI